MDVIKQLWNDAVQLDGLAEVCLRLSRSPSTGQPGDGSQGDRIGHQSGVHLGGVVGSSYGLIASIIAHQTRRPLLLVVRDQRVMESTCDDLDFWNRASDGENPLLDVLPFPHLETLPYEEKAPELEIRIDRMRVRKRLLDSQTATTSRIPVVVAPIRSLMRRLPPNELVERKAIRLKTGQRIDRERFAEQLVADDYEFHELVSGPGQFSTRGGIIDVFPVTSDVPVRLELWDDEIDSLRLFDVATQRSIDKIDEVSLLPANEVHLTDLTHKEGLELVSFQSLFPESFVIIVRESREIREEAQRVDSLVQRMYNEVGRPAMLSGEREVLPPEVLFTSLPEILRTFDTRDTLYTGEFRLSPEDTGAPTANFNIRPISFTGSEFKARLGDLAELRSQGKQVIVVCDNEGQESRLREIFNEKSTDDPRTLIKQRRPHTVVGEMHDGFTLDDLDTVIVTDREVFRRYKRFRMSKRHGIALPIEDLVDIKSGDYVVHIDHGIGRYMGLKRFEVEGKPGEYLELRYQDDDVLYVPIDQIEKVGRYVGSEAAPPPLAKLGGKAWANTKAKAKKAIEDMAAELLQMYAARQTHRGHSFVKDTPWQYEFEASFLYQETPDQIRSITEVKSDMEAVRPMDRLICGDVGFGKTEVALRAAFKAVMDGRQVAVLVPTTVLAQQHYRTFTERMAEYPVSVHVLSRFQSSSQQKESIEAIESGEADIVIGTHRLLSKDVKFRNLGLIVIDEEQRFGVKHKERLKKMRMLVDCLTLTATPIPRTLYMSLSGIRDMSIVNTPPSNRLPIETYVADFKPEVIESAILRELSRGGQVYYLHNRVESIGAMADLIQRLVPDARIAVAHGQMDEKELAAIMNEFVDGQYDILVCTTIIESGIDIPSVNTILINRADCFGLAELYQLRGRVGRDKHKAYCYLLVPAQKALTRIARRRLMAIQEFNELGSGFKVALRDLEIRGMGNVLGQQQHGHIAAIGFELYNRLLKETVSNLKGTPDKIVETVFETDDKGIIDEDYVPSPRQRMNIYKRLAQTRTLAEVEQLQEEITDRFGRLPSKAGKVFDNTRLRVLASQAGIEQISFARNKVTLKFTSDGELSGFSPEIIMALDKDYPEKFNVRLLDAVYLDVTSETPKQLRDNLPYILDRLRPAKTEPARKTA